MPFFPVKWGINYVRSALLVPTASTDILVTPPKTHVVSEMLPHSQAYSADYSHCNAAC